MDGGVTILLMACLLYIYINIVMSFLNNLQVTSCHWIQYPPSRYGMAARTDNYSSRISLCA